MNTPTRHLTAPALIGRRVGIALFWCMAVFVTTAAARSVVLELYSRPEGASTPGELCDFTSLGATNMTRIANALVERGLIKRGPSAQDRRRVEIQITPAGRRFVQKLLPNLFPPCGAAFAGFSETDKRSFSRLLLKLADNLDRLDEALSQKDAP